MSIPPMDAHTQAPPADASELRDEDVRTFRIDFSRCVILREASGNE